MSPDDEYRSRSLAQGPIEGLAAVKRELAAVLLVGLAAIPLVGLWLDGAREMLVLVAYGIGGALWVRTRARGMVLAARQRGPSEDGFGDGP